MVFRADKLVFLLVSLLFLVISVSGVNWASESFSFVMESYPGSAFDYRVTRNPSNPAAFSEIDKLIVPQEKPKITLFIQTRSGRQPIESPDEGVEQGLESIPLWRGPYTASLYSNAYVSDSYALESALISSKTFHSQDLTELEGQEGAEFYNALANMISRIPFSVDGNISTYFSSRRVRLTSSFFGSFLACYTDEPRYYFLAEEGRMISASFGRNISNDSLILAGGVNLKHIEKRKDQIIFDDDFSISAIKASGAGAGLDVGILVKLSDSLNFGIVLENVASNIDWTGKSGKLGVDNNTQVEDYNESTRDPFSLKLGIADLTEDRIMALDLEFKAASLIPSDFSSLHFAYGRTYFDNKMAFAITGFSDIKHRLVTGVTAGYKFSGGKVQINLGSADVFRTSFKAGASLTIMF